VKRIDRPKDEEIVEIGRRGLRRMPGDDQNDRQALQAIEDAVAFRNGASGYHRRPSSPPLRSGNVTAILIAIGTWDQAP